MTVKEFYEYMKTIGAENYKMIHAEDCADIEIGNLYVYSPKEQIDGIGRIYL